MSTPVTQYTTLERLARKNALRDVKTTVMTEKITEVSALMDGYFRDRYTLPFLRVGLDVQLACEAIVAYQLLLDRGFNPHSGAGDEALISAYEDAMRWLRAVANPTSGVSPDVTDSSGGPAAEAPPAPRARARSQSLRGNVGVGVSGMANTSPNGLRRGGQYPGWPDGTV
jgi:phage gp36-like protein